jgi:Ca-activated chloride channel family protein
LLIAMSLMALPPTAPPAQTGGGSTSITGVSPTSYPIIAPAVASRSDESPAGEPGQSDGALRTVANDGQPGAFCPLKHTDVKAEISGFLARVTVTQEFVNPTSDRIEAIYTFPLPQNAAVDDMTMHVGGRTIKGLIKKREEAQQIYQAAKQAGHTAALLDQERPNIFTQSVANIPANAPVKVEISYVETLKYEAGVYEFVYPMVVGPRYIPGNPTGKQSGGWSPDTDRVPDASRITPPVAGVHYGVKGSRAGHDISLRVQLDSGVPIQEMKSATHVVDVQNVTAHSAIVKLKNEKEIPNRDFVLRYDVSSSKIEDALLTHAVAQNTRESRGGGENAAKGYFTFILQPPDRVRDEDATPRELIFVLDTSGSMSGFPIETAKKVMRKAIENMRAGDTFNLITFAGDTHILFPQPVIASSSNIQQAVRFLDGQRGGGGTEMMKAIRAALGDDASGSGCGPYAECAGEKQSAIRVVCFMTDGYVGNDMEIIGEVQKHSDTRVFSFGIGSSVNRFLLDGMAKAGRGEVEYVLNAEQALPAAERFYERVHTPVLTDISIEWSGLPVTDVMPAKPLDLFTAKPLVLSGRYTMPAAGSIRLRGKRAGKLFEREIRVSLPSQEDENRSLAQLWARTKIEDLMSQDWQGLQSGTPKQGIREQITQLGLDYRLMTQFTSFVAVEEQTVVEGGVTRTVQVPVEMPQGVSPEGVFGELKDQSLAYSSVAASRAPAANGGYFALRKMAPGIVAEREAAQAGPSTAPMNRGDAAKSGSQAPVRSNEERDRREKAENRRALMESRLHPTLLAAYDCWQKTGGKNHCAGVTNGRVNIKIWLTNQTPQLQQALGTAGFMPATDRAHSLATSLELVGSVEIEKLPLLAEVSGVKLIALAK